METDRDSSSSPKSYPSKPSFSLARFSFAPASTRTNEFWLSVNPFKDAFRSMSACFTRGGFFSGVQSSSCPKFNNPDALILLVSFVCRLFSSVVSSVLVPRDGTSPRKICPNRPPRGNRRLPGAQSVAQKSRAHSSTTSSFVFTKSPPLFEDERYSIRENTKTFFSRVLFSVSKVRSHLRNDTREKEERFLRVISRV